VTHSPSAVMFIAVPSAVLAAASFGLSGALQQRATKKTSTRGILDPRLVLELVRQPQWLFGTAAVVVGLALQVVALAFGPLVFIQPLLATSILFATAASAWLAHGRLDRVVLAGAAGCVVGLAVFLSLARPSNALSTPRALGQVLPLAIALVAVVVGCIVVAAGARFSGAVHVAALALATGVIYGTTAALIKVVTAQIRSDGLFSIFTHPVLYMVCLIGPIGFLLSQQTFKQGVLIAPALAVMSIVDPLVGIALGVSWLGETVNANPAALGGAGVGIAILIAGMAVLAHRGVMVRRQLEERRDGAATVPGRPDQLAAEESDRDAPASPRA